MTTEQTQQFQQQLRHMFERLTRDKQQLLEQVQSPVGNSSNNDISTASIRPDVVGVSEGDEEVAIGLYENVERTHAEVAAALERMDAGTFGVCDRCGKKIAQIRLQAIPYASHCTTCARSQEAVARV